MAVLITGSNGFIGRNLVGRFDNPQHLIGRLENIYKPFRCDHIIHLAAQTGVPTSIADPATDFLSNTQGTFNILEMARKSGVRRVIFASSGAADNEQSPYAASKRAGEAYCKAYYHSYGLETVCLRFTNVYGPYSDHKESVIAKLIKTHKSGETPKIYGDGNQIRDFIYVDDVVDAIIASMTAPVAGEVLSIGTGIGTSLNRLCGFLPFHVGHTEGRKGDVQESIGNPQRAMRLLNWKPKTSLEEGIKRTLEYYGKSN